MTYIFLITIGIIQVFILWNWLRIIDTTSETVHVGMQLKRLTPFDFIINSLWALSFILIPLLPSLNESTNENTQYIGLFLTSLLFGKFFWDTLLPSFGEIENAKKLIWRVVWGPIANLISGVLVIKLATWCMDWLIDFILSDNLIDSINVGLNFLSDLWILSPTNLKADYQFSLGLVIIVVFVTQMRIIPLYIIRWKKIVLTLGIVALTLRTIKYIGGDFTSILNIGSDYLNESYSFISIITVCLGWIIALILKMPAKNKE